mgnify:CR=1 FL=1
MPTGTIARLLIDKGFGFIRDESGMEHFFHRSAVRGAVFELLREGQRVEFAIEEEAEGKSPMEAVKAAARLRLRPIIMTSIATAFGALPLVLWQGAGAGSRQTIGVVIFTGAMFATVLTLFVVPVIYGLLARFTKSPEWTARKIEAWEAQEMRQGGEKPVPLE